MENAPATIGNESVQPVVTSTAIDQIRAALEGGEKLTGLEALRRFGCFRLPAVVCVLKHRDGLPIKEHRITVEKAAGKTARVSQYWIES